MPFQVSRRALLGAGSALYSFFALATGALAADDATDMPEVVIREKTNVMEKYKLPNTAESITREKMADTVNVIDPEDSVKYMPSLSLRKRNNGDTQAVLMTRTWGYSSSARSMVYVDDIPITALIANDNSKGGPRWGMVAPEEMERVDMMYGPFAAQHPGNSMGGVLQITTRMPDKLEATAKQTETLQHFNLYNTKDTYRTDQSSATFGHKIGDLSVFIAATSTNSESQPVSVLTRANTTGLTSTTGTIAAVSKSGGTANVVGMGGLLRTEMQNIKAKFAYDFTPEIKATYTLGFWQNHGRSRVESYLKDASGASTFGAADTTGANNGGTFAAANYILEQVQTSHALSLKSDTKGMWDFEGNVTHVHFDRDIQKQPLGTLGGTTFTTNGKYTQMDGTNWTTSDVKGIFRPTGPGGAHEASFGAHYDRYILVAPTYTTANWRTEAPITGKTTDSRGDTQTYALWAQDAWKLTDTVKATLGGRWEYWESFNGYVLSGNTSAYAPATSRTAFSPKATLAWEIVPQWTVTGQAAKSTRFPTVSELFMTGGTGVSTSVANPNLQPERTNSYELSLETTLGEGKTRVSLFQENVTNALISQSNVNTTGTGTSTYVTNVLEIRNRGIELAAQQNNVVISGLELAGSLTYVDAEIIKNPAWALATQTVGKRVPNIPTLRGTVAATYRPTDEWAFTTAARYQDRMATTMDNTDYVNKVYGSFDSFFVIDVRARYKHSENLEAALGIDNVNDCRYMEFHPFPQRTFIAELKLKL
ncbi:TonB-dependent receptor [Paramagnetospirillum magnetotacticum MS-1]|uniref:TonB-dependent receptor n=1 Tax=Paramagnetospirillum magnetotacticum MS-1 TaxID=272627 RepID=A0A0C2YHS7_PARME|nr:TonB-dependent receptor [Paramagnetospirillum magnetotacticum]KIL99314.1 TonB-dependent receptor [Paramagnetospirillum magnetotacticum MS-1]